ncbi:nicotinate-nucleotide-dimethylbenzimidazole phosphoribosyltransferase /cob(II)yrinic acid a,c-diamide reductase [Actinacidiphila yanglinensis]|uniref:Nicotinate-nucleotide--dimethylbenzimidazole phosphoribosyltransferase n=1 Tax=Actinacidiphila yanglinensis TaxID=310779 RepID=A0A1H6CJT2_9ACTN|nr:nicotinate-nucleotide--dimethylbenzimidazole phosphoribosyltransferase [Actinacidiphila yanglinensis]SEG73033.1 nicotinate-nucleotide-dimethylbenzimidazole phosphoribosyltransferase /cob(II)yrinic acid a,c-diamide reductase [Actinacidiphila yanglinensis]
MTDTGQIPGEGLPENAGADAGADALLPPHTAFPGNGAPQQPDWGTAPVSEQPAPGYAYLEQPAPPGAGLDDEDDVLLMPGPQGSWSDPQPVPSPASVPAQQQPPYVQNGQQPQQHRVGPVQVQPHPQPASLRQQPVDLPISVEVPVEVPLETIAAPVLGNGAQVFVAQQPQQLQQIHEPQAPQARQFPPQQAVPAAPAQLGLAEAPAHPGATQAEPVAAQDQVPAVAAAGEPAGAAEQAASADGAADAAGSAAAQPAAPVWNAPAEPSPVPQQAPVSRRPLHMGPPVADTPSGGVSVRSLADRGPAVHVQGPPTSGPEYLDVPRDDVNGIPAQQTGEPGPGAVAAPGSTWPSAPGGASQQSLIPRADSVPRPAEQAAAPQGPTVVAAQAEAAPVQAAHPHGQEQEQGAAVPVGAGVGAAGVQLATPQAGPAPAAPVAPSPAAAEQQPAAQPAAPVPPAPSMPSAPEPAAAQPVVPEAVVPAQGGPVASQGGGFAVPQTPEQTAGPVPVTPAAPAAAEPAVEVEPVPAELPAPEPAPAAAPVAEAAAETVSETVVEAGSDAVAAVAPPQSLPAAADPVEPAAEPATVTPDQAAAEQPAAATPARGRRGRRRAGPAAEEAETFQRPESELPEQSQQPADPAADAAPAPVAAPEPAVPASAPDGPAEPEDTAMTADAPGTIATNEAPAVAERVAQGPAAEPYEPAVRDAVHRVIRERRDIRNGFRSDPIPHDVLLRVLEAAHTAPSVGHSQPWDFVVIRSEKTREKMHELAMRQREAYAKSLPKARARQFRELKIEAILDTPVNIVVTADPTRGGRHTLGRHTQPQMAPYSSALAVENLWLAARAEGLGVGWVSFFDERQMVTELGLPEHLEVVAYLCVGYVDEFPEEPELMQAGWSQRRPLSWVVHEEEYGNRALPGEEPHDLLEETLRGIRPLDAKALGEAWERQKRMTKPAGALGMLEIISAQLSGLSRQCPPPIPEPAAVAVFAGDHGVHAQGVTAWPQEVTGQMVANILGGGAVCNAFANQVGAEVCVVDVGVASELPATPGLLPRKVRPGTADFTVEPAMSREDVLKAIEVGIETARDLVAAGNKALLTGEMGIANTTASAAIVAVYTGADPSEVTGRGTGINDEMHARKVEVVRRALDLHRPDPDEPIQVLAAIGGLEHAAMVGLLLGAAALRTPVILDGVSAGAAALVARAIAPEVLAACIAGHRSAEPGHVAALTTLGLRPLVDLDLRLGEGTGALLALPLVQSAARVMHEVATFDAAGVTEKG